MSAGLVAGLSWRLAGGWGAGGRSPSLPCSCACSDPPGSRLLLHPSSSSLLLPPFSYTDIKRKEGQSIFIRPHEGLFGLREWIEQGVAFQVRPWLVLLYYAMACGGWRRRCGCMSASSRASCSR